jgi:hypothetical protein
MTLHHARLGKFYEFLLGEFLHDEPLGAVSLAVGGFIARVVVVIQGTVFA